MCDQLCGLCYGAVMFFLGVNVCMAVVEYEIDADINTNIDGRTDYAMMIRYM